MCLIDLDHFKDINDSYGHLAGDRVLAEVGRLLSGQFRSHDLRCRWGGEEFALAFPGEAASTMAGGMQRVLEDLMEIEFVSDDGRKFHVSFSGGVAQLGPDGSTIEKLIRVADERLYTAKRRGRKRIVSAAAVLSAR